MELPLRSSSLPVYSYCSHFKSDEGGEYAQRGNRIHSQCYHYLKPDQFKAATDDPGEKEEAEWAADYIRINSSDEHELEIEQSWKYITSDWRTIATGHTDAVSGPEFFDLKTGDYHDYWYQLAAYGAMLCRDRGYSRARGHSLYTRLRKPFVSTFHKEIVETAVEDLVENLVNGPDYYEPNDFCKYCTHLEKCEAVIERVEAVGSYKGFLPGTLDPDNLDDPAELAKALRIRIVVEDWCKAIKKKGYTAAENEDIPGFTYFTRKGNRYIDSIDKAFQASGLSKEDFLASCTVSIGKLKDALANSEEMSASDADKELTARLGDLIQRGASTAMLRQKSNKPRTKKNG